MTKFWKIAVQQFNVCLIFLSQNLIVENHDLEWPRMTSNDFETKLFEKISSRASFWSIICLLFKKFKIWPFSRFLTLGDLRRPQITLRLNFLERSFQELHSKVLFVHFWEILRFDHFFAIFDLGWPQMTLTSAFLKSWCEELYFDIWFAYFDILKFDPKWPQICKLTRNPEFLDVWY